MVDVVTAGESMVLLLAPGPGRLRHAPFVELRVGGAESNVAIALARLGVSAGWVSWLGTDELGDLVLARIRSEGVDTCCVRRVPEAPTGLYLRDRVGNRVRVYYYRHGSAASRMRPNAFDPAYLDGAKIFHITGITPALSDSCREFTIWAVQEAKARGLQVSYDVNFRSRLWSAQRARGFLEEILPLVDVLFVSQEDAIALWGSLQERLLEDLAARGPQEVIATRGAEGCVALIDGRWYRQPAFDVPEVDPVGAGDAFVGGYLAASIWGLSPEERLQVGAAVAAFVVMSPGDYEGLPTYDELWTWLQRKESVSR